MGCIHIYTGDGKGKTTAAIGLAVRAAGAGKNVAFLCFDKGPPQDDSFYCERNILHAIAEVDVHIFGCSRIKPDGTFRYKNCPDDMEEAARGLEVLRQLIKLPNYFLIVADEIIMCVYCGLIHEDDLCSILREYKKKPYAELVLTGRGASEKLIEMADLVTDMHNVKHYYETQRPPIKGIEH